MADLTKYKNSTTFLSIHGIYYCPGCLKEITSENGEIHHVKPINHGGTDSKRNKILICDSCHNIIHQETTRDNHLVWDRVRNYMLSIHGLLTEWLECKYFFTTIYPAPSHKLDRSFLQMFRKENNSCKFHCWDDWYDLFPDDLSNLFL